MAHGPRRQGVVTESSLGGAATPVYVRNSNLGSGGGGALRSSHLDASLLSETAEASGAETDPGVSASSRRYWIDLPFLDVFTVVKIYLPLLNCNWLLLFLKTVYWLTVSR